MTNQEIRAKILETLYEHRSSDFTEPQILLEAIDASEEVLDTEIRYLKEKYLVSIMGAFMGKQYLNFAGVKITSRGTDIVEKAKIISAQNKNPSNSLEDKTDEELEAIIRQAVNPHIPGSLHQRAQIELDIRHRKKMEQSTNRNPGEVKIIAETLNNNGIIGSEVKSSSVESTPKEGFLSKFFWQFIVVIIAGIVVALIVAHFITTATR